MAASSGFGLVTEPTTISQQSQEVFQWLKNLPLAPEYHPTLSEFQDPIAYIFKIEKEASNFGICKIVPPVLPAPKKTAITNFNRSLAARAVSSSKSSPPTFTTRQQQIGFCPRKSRPVKKPVWQSGENYTFQEFEAKAKSFERIYFKKCSPKKTNFSPLEVETLYWKATVDKPFSVEYANDMPGSAFSVKKEGGGKEINEGVTVGETEWNMRGVSRAKGSLLRFMKEEIPGVTSPMVYVAMMFSWFAWHVEDHDLHSLNYMHMGAGKTWYGVPREAAVAFEEVVRDHGYGGEINPLVTFSVLGEKTTVMSPEVFISAGVPCCRLVQNAGEFVVTFPRAYHSGFSHGFNCGEAANIATPEWLRVAKDAAIRRASINYPPMVSHFQLLYDLALELCTRMPVNINLKPRSSRLKDKQKGEGDTLVKDQFVKNMIHNNELLHILGKGSSVVLLPRSSSDISVCSNLRVGSQLRANLSLGSCSNKGIMNSSKKVVPDENILDRNHRINQLKGVLSVKEKFASLCEQNRFSSLNGKHNKNTTYTSIEHDIHGEKLSDQRLFSCVTCGILSFDCIAVIQPTEKAARYLMSADCSFFNDWIVGSGVTNDGLITADRETNSSEQDQPTGLVENNVVDGLYDVPVQSVNCELENIDQNIVSSDAKTQKESSALGLLALNYGNSSDSEEDQDEIDASHHADEMPTCSSESKFKYQNSALPLFKQESLRGETMSHTPSSSRLGCKDKFSLQTHDCPAEHGHRPGSLKDGNDGTLDCSVEFETDNLANMESNGFDRTFRDSASISCVSSNCSPDVYHGEKKKFSKVAARGDGNASFAQRSDEDSSRMHVFCLEHAIEVEQQLRTIGGVYILLLCHPEYPRLEGEAKLVSEELGIDYLWNEIAFRDAAKNDEENIQSALDSEEAIPGNGDWAVKLGINLFYSANLSRSSLYSKQMPYNSVVYKAFGRISPASSPTKLIKYGRRSVRQRKVVGRWCGKVWMSNQVHPFLSKKDSEDRDQEQEEGGFRGWIMPDEKTERKPQSLHKTEITSTGRKSARKRKMTVASRPMKKVKSPDPKDVASDDLEEDISHKRPTKVYSRKQTKHIEKEFSYDSLDYSHQQHERSRRSKQAKSIEREEADTYNSWGRNSHQQDRRLPRSKQVKSIEGENDVSDALAGSNSQKQHNRIHRTRSKQVKCAQRKSEMSNYSEEADIREQRGRVPRSSSQVEFYEREEAVSDDSLEDTSDQPIETPHRHEDAISDDSLENNYLHRNRMISRGSQAKYFEKEDEVSEDLPEESSYKQHRGSHTSRKNEFTDREDDISDDLLDDNSPQEGMRDFRSKQARFVEREDEVSDDSLEGNFLQQQQQRIPTSKRAKYVVSEHAVSDDMEDETHLKHWRTPRSKKAKLTDSEDFSDDDAHEDDGPWKSRKTPRGKPAKVIEREAVSDDMEETHWQQRKTCRQKQATSFESEDVSDDLQEEGTHWKPNRGKQTKFSDKEYISDDLLDDDDTHWQPIKTPPRGKQAKFIEPEDAVSDELVDDNSTKQKMMNLRRKHKPGTLRKMKQAMSQVRKKENPKSVKQEKQMKLETPRLRNGKTELEGGPSTRLRTRLSKPPKELETKLKEKLQTNKKNTKGASAVKPLACKKNGKTKDDDAEYQCEIEGCTMSFGSKQELALHKKNICPVKGCGKTFFSHKYLVQHRRVHLDDRPLKCPWKGCKMTFKWAWARTEHIRVHTGARPYVCGEEGCGQTFRFVSDFSRHKRKTGHSIKKSKK
ncbi:lysine-specific demethylase REF6 [Mercurialis annua]|uniref:lysine-specific demethylase REF6 n=1 Tax=Mercurialis annua TaxID=3986 RepID=UPI00215DE865|nr:lysine-specific demethylase REF6 [Mercurialis annua]